jgi:hypothetical protein
MIPSRSDETEFNHWYDDEHIPLRMAAPGFISAQRYRVTGTRHYFVIYEMDSPMALKTPEYQKIKNNPSELTTRMLRSVTGFTRYIGEQIGAHAGESAAIDAPYIRVDFFNSEFDSSALFESKHSLMVRRFSIMDGEPEKYTGLSVHYLAGRPDSVSTEPAPARQLVFERHGVRQYAA